MGNRGSQLENQELQKARASTSKSGEVQLKGWVDDELLYLLAENLRLQALVRSTRKVHQLETQNALNANWAWNS
jgi:hypothetical protein